MARFLRLSVAVLPLALCVACVSAPARAEKPAEPEYPPHVTGALPTADGFRGIWYSNQPSNDEYAYKYSGGLGTYTHQHKPLAIYAPVVDTTFFVYGGRYRDRNQLLHMVGAFDHKTGKLARPRVLLDKRTDDAHDNPVMSIDDDGHIWVFSNAHGTGRPSYIHRSVNPHDISAFEHVTTTNFSYGQPWWLTGRGFVFLHTKYVDGKRFLHEMRSEDGRAWTEPRRLAGVAEGHYQMSRPFGDRLGTAFNYHPAGKGLNWRTNLYYMESVDGGETWRTIDGKPLDLPLTEPDNAARILEYESKKRLVYLKDMAYTPDGRPVLLYLTSGGFESGPANDPRTLTIAEWTGQTWRTTEVAPADNNYDFGSLYVESATDWRIVAALGPGPQAFNTGGEIAMLTTSDAGRTWRRRALTHDSKWNHTYPRRPVDAQPVFYAFWADGHGREPSDSRLYFCTRDGAVFRMPPAIPAGEDWVEPESLD